MKRSFVSSCICSVKKQIFIPYIVYKNETVFKAFNGLIIAKCNSCGMLKTISGSKNAVITPEISEVAHYEAHRSENEDGFDELVTRVKKYKRSGSVLEVGAASGNLMQAFQKGGFNVMGIEPNKKAFNMLFKTFGSKVHKGYIKDFMGNNNTTFDIVIYNHVLEHILDPKKELRMIKTILENNGILVIGVPNFDNVVFKMRKKYWESLLPNQHIWHFSTKYLSSFLESMGFNVLEHSFNNHQRYDYPFHKKIYFGALTVLNKIFNTGEAVLILATL